MTSTESVTWPSRTEAVATWYYLHGTDEGPRIATSVICERVPGDWIADGDAPEAVLEAVADAAADRVNREYDRRHR